MSFARIQGREKPVTEETFSHHVLPAANKFCHPHKILTGGETELNLDMVQEVKCVAVKHTEALAGYPYEVVNTFFVPESAWPRTCLISSRISGVEKWYCERATLIATFGST